MRVLYYDCFCGISGDMNLGALVDLGVDPDYLIRELAKLRLDGEYRIAIRKETKHGITGTKVDVILNHGEDEGEHHEHDGDHAAHSGAHDGHPHCHNHAGHGEPHEHQHRNIQDIRRIIQGSDLPEKVKQSSLDMFLRIAQAEAKVHGKPIDEVHFHEVGAIDSIVDIVGAAIALDSLQVDQVLASTVQVGGGFVRCAHGVIPVPAPATVELLKGIPIKSGLVPFETTTPTGAAILAANVERFTDQLAFTVEKIGYGVGGRDLDVPNVLRVYLGTVTEDPADRAEQYILETNIDDMNPELFGYIEERLFAAGALDVYRTPIIMKKGRSAVKLSILVNDQCENAVREIILRESTSLGMRRYRVDKIMLDRRLLTISTVYGEIRIKRAYDGEELVKYKAEYEDCRKAAIANHVPIAKVYREVDKIMETIVAKGQDLP
jgi:uncharacterized protein (TIGR00299 family) protein